MVLLFEQVWENVRTLVLFLVPGVLFALLIHRHARLPRYVFRKLLHMLAFSGITLMLMTSRSWQASMVFSLLVVILGTPVLAFLENKPWYGSFFVEKSKGEVKRSLVLLFIMFAVLIAVGSGWFRKTYAAAAAILMWGTGDAMAALIGIPFGKHKVRWKITDGKKSAEGTAAMFLCAFLVGFAVLCFATSFSALRIAVMSLVGAFGGAFTELVTPSEYDTVTVPLCILAILILL